MRIGFVVEGSNEDAGDVHAVRALCSRLSEEHGIPREPIIVAGGKKPAIIEDAHKHVSALREKGCARVILMWDVKPPLVKSKKRMDDYVCGRAIVLSLAAEGVSNVGVELIAARQELEAWILSDETAIKDVLETIGGGPTPGVSGSNAPDTVSDPKDRLHNWWYLKRNRTPYGTEYGAMFEKARLTKLRRSPSFCRFERKVIAP